MDIPDLDDVPAHEQPESRHLRGPRSELTPRAVLVGLAVAAFVGASYPYIVLKIGFGPTMSVVSAFFAYIGLNAIARLSGRPTGRFEYNIVQTAGTAAAQAAFMCVVLAAFDLLAAKPELGMTISPTPVQVFLWMSVAGCLGVLLAVPLRKHFIDEEKLTFADGTAAGESLLILDADPGSAKDRVKMLGLGGLIGALSTWLRDGYPRPIPEATMFGAGFAKLNVGMNWSALSFGAGLIVGLRITLSMGLGMLVAWVVLPDVLVSNGWLIDAKGQALPATFSTVLRWVMWPATGMMVAGGLTALVLKWKLIARTFTDMARGHMADGTDFPMKWVAIGSVSLSLILIVLQNQMMGVALWEGAAAILISIVLMLVGIRVLGETNWAPISAMANMVQAVFAVLSPGSIGVNMVASGMSGSVAGAGETLMQDYKAGKIIGSNNRALTYMQLIATPVGAGAIAVVYPLLKRQYGIGGDCFGRAAELGATKCTGLSSPISVKWAGFSELLMNGIGSLEVHALYGLGIAVVLGVVITVLEDRWKQYLPSPTGIALGMLIPAMFVLPMVLGGVTQHLWHRRKPAQEAAYNIPLASGLIVGEAMLALVIPLLVYFGVLAAAGGGH